MFQRTPDKELQKGNKHIMLYSNSNWSENMSLFIYCVGGITKTEFKMNSLNMIPDSFAVVFLSP